MGNRCCQEDSEEINKFYSNISLFFSCKIFQEKGNEGKAIISIEIVEDSDLLFNSDLMPSY